MVEADDSKRLWIDGTAACSDKRTFKGVYQYVAALVLKSCILGLRTFANSNDCPAEGSTLDDIIKRSTPLHPAERARVIEQTPALAEAHKAAATEGDTPAPDAQDDVDLHYVCFVKGNDGNLWELDGRRKGPINRGPLNNDEDVLSDKGLNLGVLKFLEREGGDLRFSAVALAGTLD